MKHILVIGGLLALLAESAMAAPIAAGSEFNITGAATFDSTSVTFSNPESVPIAGTSGDFTGFGSCVGCVTMTSPLIYAPFTPGQIYSAINGVFTTSFTIDGIIDAPVVGTHTLILHDSGTAYLTGFDPTPGEWIFTINQFNITGSFSATTAVEGGGGGGGPIPEPTSLALLGAGLVGLGIRSCRRKS
jgi:hypothetical protein